MPLVRGHEHDSLERYNISQLASSIDGAHGKAVHQRGFFVESMMTYWPPLAKV
jgi:hypothetical protein